MVTLTYYGRVNSGYDYLGVFGTPNTTLDHERYTAIYYFNTAFGLNVSTAGAFNIFGGPGTAALGQPSPALGALITIRNHSVFIDGPALMGGGDRPLSAHLRGAHRHRDLGRVLAGRQAGAVGELGRDAAAVGGGPAWFGLEQSKQLHLAEPEPLADLLSSVERRRWLAVHCRRGALRLTWRLRLLTGHNAEVRSVAFSPDGSQILSGSRDATKRLSPHHICFG
jgi:WD40 repeat protein